MTAAHDSMPGHLLRRCHQIAVAIFLDECAGLDLTPLQFAVLDSLHGNGPQDQVTLGGAAALDRTTISTLLRKLEARGLVRRARCTRDQRANIVTLTAAGKRLVLRAMASVEAAQQRILAPLGKAEQAQLIKLLQKLAHGNNALSRAPVKAATGKSGSE